MAGPGLVKVIGRWVVARSQAGLRVRFAGVFRHRDLDIMLRLSTPGQHVVFSFALPRAVAVDVAAAARPPPQDETAFELRPRPTQPLFRRSAVWPPADHGLSEEHRHAHHALHRGPPLPDRHDRHVVGAWTTELKGSMQPLAMGAANTLTPTATVVRQVRTRKRR